MRMALFSAKLRYLSCGSMERDVPERRAVRPDHPKGPAGHSLRSVRAARNAVCQSNPFAKSTSLMMVMGPFIAAWLPQL